MRFGLKTLAVSLFALLGGGQVFAVSLTATLDRDSVTLGESVTLSLKFDDANPQGVPGLPPLPGLSVGQPTRQFYTTSFNGVGSASVIFSFPLTPQKAGELVIPALTMNVNGQRLSTQPLKLKVSQPSAPSAAAINSGNERAFMKLELPRNKFYAGEEVTAQLLVYRREEIDIANFGLATTSADGFKIGKMAQGQNRRQVIGNHVFVVTPVSVALTVERTGPLALGPFTAGVVLLVPSENAPMNPMFRGMFTEQRQVSLVTDAVNAEGIALPMQGRPADFKGLIANFDVAVSAGPASLTVGDPVTVRVQVSGHGPLDDLKLPEPLDVKDFKIFQSSSTITNLDPLGVEGTKIFEFVAAPQNADVHEWPKFNLSCNGSTSYFNPADGRYHTLAVEAVPLTVKAAGATPLPPMAAGKNAEEKSTQDILPIKDKLGKLTQAKTPLVTQPAFLAAQAVPVLAFLAAFVWRKRTDNLANNPRLRRQRAVAQLVRDGLADLKKFAAENKPDEFFATLFRLLQEQLGERLDCPASAITEDVVDGHALLRNAPATLRAALHEQFQLCNQARYAPVRGTSELNSVAAQFEKLIGELQNLKS